MLQTRKKRRKWICEPSEKVRISAYPKIFHKFFGKAIMNREQNSSPHNICKFQIRSCSLDRSKVRSRVLVRISYSRYPPICDKNLFGKCVFSDKKCVTQNTYQFQSHRMSVAKVTKFDSYRVTGLTGSTGHFFPYFLRFS